MDNISQEQNNAKKIGIGTQAGSSEERIQTRLEEMAKIRLRNDAKDGLEAEPGTEIKVAGDGSTGRSVLLGGPPSLHHLRDLLNQMDSKLEEIEAIVRMWHYGP